MVKKRLNRDDSISSQLSGNLHHFNPCNRFLGIVLGAEYPAYAYSKTYVRAL